ncbi:glyceraldehyde 3-phosphate dehydrogenase, NAD binding domain-containing protein [Phthorimaea operculella]|nr:glyceraldehyde 3-phosphate dehydrogenase, NAD binding domain-containing protein [Phthorimaea operculella]
MVLRVGINGFGRVGRVVLRTCLERSDVEVCAVNDPAIDISYICYLIKYDSTHGTLRRNITHTENEISIDDARIKVFHEKFPTGIPWQDAGVEYVVEASGMFTSMDKASGHLVSDGVKRVIVTAPCVDVPMVIFGVNEKTIKSSTKVISCGSSTLYCLAPIIKILEDNYGVEEGFITSIHAMTPSLKPLDGLCLKGKHWRDHRSITQNIIPAATGACKALGRIIPAVKDRMCGLAFRVPIANVSVMDLSVRLKKFTSIAKIAENIEKFNETTKNIIKINSDESVSSDFLGDSYSCILDINSSIQLKPNSFKLICWYENEYSYACRVIDLITFSENQFIEIHRRAIMGVTTQYREETPAPSEKEVKVRPKTTNSARPSVGLKNQGEVSNKKTGGKSVVWFNPQSVLMGKIWNDGDGTARHSRSSAFFHPCACTRSPPGRSPVATPPPSDTSRHQTEGHRECTSRDTVCNKAQDRLEKVKQEFTKMVNITESLLKKSKDAKLGIKTKDDNKIVDTKKLEENLSISTLKAVENFTPCSSSISNSTNNNITNPFPSTNTLNTQNVVDQNGQLLEPVAKATNVAGIDECNEKDNSKTNLQNDTKNEPEHTQFDENHKEDLHVDKLNEVVDGIDKKVTDEGYYHISITDVSKHDNIEIVIDATNEGEDDVNIKENPSTNEDASNEVPLEENAYKNDRQVQYCKVGNVHFEENSRGGEVRRDADVYFEENACTHPPNFGSDRGASRVSSPCCTDREDIYDKLDSDSDSEHSFDAEKKKSQVIKITDLTNSLEDLDRLDKICKIMEISDELSDSLFSALNTNSESNAQLAKTRWSFKDLCEKVNLDEFCDTVFGK